MNLLFRDQIYLPRGHPTIVLILNNTRLNNNILYIKYIVSKTFSTTQTLTQTLTMFYNQFYIKIHFFNIIYNSDEIL